ncbi:MAG TPA: sialidase family protein [Gaiella sp.]|nr:sialidase family protein [Gaiella sp.]
MRHGLTIALCAIAALSVAGSALADVEISDQTYVRHDGGTDVTIASCSSDANTTTAGGERQQNEPAAAVAPNNPMHMTAGANDYCTVPTTTDAWAGFYYSSNGGVSWTNSLLPGYPTDTSAAGQTSPLFRFVTAAGDPVQAWSTTGKLFYGGIAFNRARPVNGSIWLARYDWPMVATAPRYEFTTLVSRGVPGSGPFEDKVQLEVDKGVASPHAGNVYMCWARFQGAGNNSVQVARSTDGGQTFDIQKVSEGVHGSQFCDIAVTRNGTVFVAWRQFDFSPGASSVQNDAVAWVKSTDGGRTYSKPAVAKTFTHWDLTDHFGSPAAAGQALFDACLAADYTVGACRAGPEPRNDARDCGDGPLVCQSGYVFHRAATQVRIAADPNGAPATADDAYVVYDASVPTSLTSTGTSYGTIESGVGSQASTYFIKTTNGGASWTGGTGGADATRIDVQPAGHQFFPDIDAEGGVLHAVWQDSRNDCATGPAGGDFRTVPIANDWVPANPPGGVSCAGTAPANPDGAGVISVYATSSNFGATWATETVSTAVTMPQHEQFGNRDVPFFGDYNYIDAVAGTVLMDWTDHREVLEGPDPRYPLDGVDGFDVFQTRACTGTPPVCGADTTPNARGLDQSIFGAVNP